MYIDKTRFSIRRARSGQISNFLLRIEIEEAGVCGLDNETMIKIVDDEKGRIIIKKKGYTLTPDIIKRVIELKRLDAIENDMISEKYCEQNSGEGSLKTITHKALMQMYEDEEKGVFTRPRRKEFEAYLSSLSLEMLADLVLLMYLGRDGFVDMNAEPGLERFLAYYENYAYLILGEEKDGLIENILGKTPLEEYLRMGQKLLQVPAHSKIKDIRSWA